MRLKSIIPGLLLSCCTVALYSQMADSSVLQVVVDEDFANTTSTWPLINHGDTAFTKINEGHYILNIRNANRFWALRMSPLQLEEKPAQLEMRVMLTSDEESPYYGMIFNTVRKAPDIFDEYRFMISKDGYYAIVQRVDGHNIVLVRGTPCSCIKDRYNILRVSQLADSTHSFYINDREVFRKKLPPTNMAVFGFYVDAHSVMYVDRIKVYKRR